MMNPGGERRLAGLMMIGCGLIVAGALLFLLFFLAGLIDMVQSKGSDVSLLLLATPMALLGIGGIGTIAYTIFKGFRLAGGDKSGNVIEVPECWIVSRFAINEVGEMIFGNFEEDAPGGKLYVQIRYPDGRTSEFQTVWGVFCQCGEGMRGSALSKGNWLTGFAPLMTPSQPIHDPYAQP